MSVLSRRRIFALSVFVAANYYIGIHLRRSNTTGNNSSIIRKTNNGIVALQTQIPSKIGRNNFKNYYNDSAPYISSSTQENISSSQNISSSSSNILLTSYDNGQPIVGSASRTNVNETETKNISSSIEIINTTIQEDKILKDLDGAPYLNISSSQQNSSNSKNMDNYTWNKEEGVGEDNLTQSRVKCYPNNTRTSTSSMVIPMVPTPKLLSGTIVLQTMGEMGNNLAALTYYYAVKTLAYEEFNLNLTLHIRKQKHKKADSAAQNVKCLKSFRDVDFDECNWFQNEKGKICQDKVNSQFKGFKHLARCTDNHTIVELSENLRMTSGTSYGIRSILKVYVDMLKDESIMELFREMNIGWTTDEPWPFLCNKGRIHASDQLINEFYSKGLQQFFAFDSDTKTSSGCCSQFPEKDENVFHYRSFIKDLRKNNRHMHWGGAELRPDNAATMLLESLPSGSKVAIVSGRSDMDRVLAYKHAFQNSTFSVRVIRGKKSIHDFCFLAHAQAGLWGTIQSTFIRWASLINTDLQNATLYGVNYPMRDEKITSKVSSNPDLARVVHYPVFDLLDEDVW